MDKNITGRMADLQKQLVAVPLTVPWRSRNRSEGDRRSTSRGTGLEFCDVRDYRPGDKLRTINWRMLDRRPDRPQVNVFESERKVEVNVLVDVGAGMRYGTQDLSKLELASVVAGSCLMSAAKTWEPGRVCCFDRSGIRSRLPVLRETISAQAMAPLAMASVLSGGKLGGFDQPAESGMAAALDEVLVRPSSLVFVLSDFMETGELEWKALQRCVTSHEVVCVLISDRLERELPDTRFSRWLPLPALFDLRTANGDRQVLAGTSSNRRRYAEQQARLFAEIRRRIAEAGAKSVDFGNEEDEESRRLRMAFLFSGPRVGPDLNVNLTQTSGIGRRQL